MSGLRRCHTCQKLVRIEDAGPENALAPPKHYCSEHDPNPRPRSQDDPTCNICGEPKSAHIATSEGPFTHPREARGEGKYVLARSWTQGGFFPGEESSHERYEFIPIEDKSDA
jgi:hypothetical protein